MLIRMKFDNLRKFQFLLADKILKVKHKHDLLGRSSIENSEKPICQLQA